MSEQAREISTTETVTRMRPAEPAAREPWSAAFTTCEHPETARLHVQRDFVEAIAALKRQSTDQSYKYLTALIDKAKDELGHARSASNDLRRATLQQHIDELVAYCAGHGISARLPNRNGEALGQSLAHFYVLDEVPTFLGEIKFLIDLWYDGALAKVHDEMLALTGLAAKLR
jgi:hypothetical protein